MPQQLIYTSAPRGLVAGRSGFCTVAMSSGMREALVLRLEQLSYLDHGASGNVSGRVVRAFRSLDIRGTRYFVLSRIQDCGLDFTQRSNFVAHHLVFTSDEFADVSMPSEIFRHWRGWLTQWNQDAQILENEQWANLYAIARREPPARSWASLTGDAMNALGLLEISNNTFLNADGIEDDTLLDLFSEAAALMEIRERRGDWRAAAWQQTFTTQHQQQDAPSDFRWRCFAGEVPTSAIGNGRVLPLLQVRPSRVSVEEASFARSGYQPPKIVTQPADARVTEGEAITLHVEASGIPAPTQFQWFAYSRTGAEEPIPDGTTTDLRFAPPRGRNRYVVKVSNSRGEVVVSRVAEVSVDAPVTIRSGATPQRHLPKLSSERPDAEQSWAADSNELQAFLDGVTRQKRRKILLGTCLVITTAALAAFLMTHQELVSTLKAKLMPGRHVPNIPPGTQAVVVAASDTNPVAKIHEQVDEPEQLFAVFLGPTNSSTLDGKLADHFSRLHQGKTNELIWFTAVDWRTSDFAGAITNTITPQPNLVCTSRGATIAFNQQKGGVTISCTNLATPHILRFEPTNSAWRAFRVLIWPAEFKTNEHARLENGKFAIDAPFLRMLHNVEANGKLSLEFNHQKFGKVVAQEYRAEYDLDKIYSLKTDAKRSEVAALKAQKQALTAVNRLRNAVIEAQQITPTVADMWAEIEAVCALAIQGNYREVKYGFADRPGLTVNRREAAAYALRELSSTKFRDAATAALNEETFKALDGVRSQSSIIPRSIAEADADVEKQLRRAEDDLVLRPRDLTASILVGGKSKRSIMALSIK